MPKVIDIKIENDHTAEAIAAMKRQAVIALQSIGQEAEGYAKAECPVDTGNLRNSITNEVIDDESELAVYIGTNVEYAPYVELGTGKYADNGRGRKTPWVYVDDKGVGHRTSGQKPVHFLRDAVADHGDRYKDILEAALKQ